MSNTVVLQGPLACEPNQTPQPIPAERIHYDGVLPLADDGLELWLRVERDSVEVAIHHILGANLDCFLRKKHKGDEQHPLVNGSIATFKERLSWDRIAELTAQHVIKLVDAVRPRALNPHHVLHTFLMERLVEVCIKRTADGSGIEYILRFQDDLTLIQRVPWKNCSDIFDP